MKPSRVVLLGPQAQRPTVGEVVRELAGGRPVATITAGWQEWESDDGALRAQLGGRVLPLELYARAERAWAADPELRDAHGAVQADLRLLQGLYARQLARAGESWMELLATAGPEHVVGPERDAALEVIRELDARHLDRIEAMRAAFEEEHRPAERTAVRRERAEIEALLERADVVVIEGGHAAVISNRLSMFGVPELFGGKTVVGCAAGAMVLGSRVLLYNDAPAIGRGHAELGLRGLGLVPGVIALPDANRRLRLDDPERMRRLALRLAPERCALLDAGSRLDWDGARVTGRAQDIAADGTVRRWEHAA